MIESKSQKLEVLLQGYHIDRKAIYERLSLAVNNQHIYNLGMDELDDELTELSHLENKIVLLDSIISSMEMASKDSSSEEAEEDNVDPS